MATDGLIGMNSNEKGFLQGLSVPMPGTRTARLLGIGLPGFPTLMLHRLIGQEHATCRRELFDILRTHAETKKLKDYVTWPTFSAMPDPLEP